MDRGRVSLSERGFTSGARIPLATVGTSIRDRNDGRVSQSKLNHQTSPGVECRRTLTRQLERTQTIIAEEHHFRPRYCLKKRNLTTRRGRWIDRRRADDDTHTQTICPSEQCSRGLPFAVRAANPPNPPSRHTHLLSLSLTSLVHSSVNTAQAVHSIS